MTLSSQDAQPVPQGNYSPASRHGDLIFTAGMTPRRGGVLISLGKVSADLPPQAYREAVVQACRNALGAARAMLGPEEDLYCILSMTVFIAAEDGYSKHSQVADLASDFLQDEFGERGRCSRCAVGVATLPGNAPVEIQLVAAARKDLF